MTMAAALPSNGNQGVAIAGFSGPGRSWWRGSSKRDWAMTAIAGPETSACAWCSGMPDQRHATPRINSGRAYKYSTGTGITASSGAGSAFNRSQRRLASGGWPAARAPPNVQISLDWAGPVRDLENCKENPCFALAREIRSLASQGSAAQCAPARRRHYAVPRPHRQVAMRPCRSVQPTGSTAGAAAGYVAVRLITNASGTVGAAARSRV